MPFERLDVKEYIEESLKADPVLRQMWVESRTEYKVIAELAKIRQEKGLSQSELASLSGNNPQVVSRIENKENSPTLKTLCSLLDVLGYDIQLVKKE